MDVVERLWRQVAFGGGSRPAVLLLEEISGEDREGGEGGDERECGVSGLADRGGGFIFPVVIRRS